jgi:uncharacterized protein (TIGR00369 family)
MVTPPAPRNPRYAERVRESVASQPLMARLFGARVTKVEPGMVEIELDVQADYLQPHGHAHGVILAALADSATGYAAQTLLAPEFDVVTVEYKINYLAPAFGERMRARGTVMRSGRSLSVCAGDVFATNAQGDKLVAHMVATLMAVPS